MTEPETLAGAAHVAVPTPVARFAAVFRCPDCQARSVGPPTPDPDSGFWTMRLRHSSPECPVQLGVVHVAGAALVALSTAAPDAADLFTDADEDQVSVWVSEQDSPW